MDSYYVWSPGLDSPYEVAGAIVPPFQERHVTSLKNSLTWSTSGTPKFQLPTMSLHSSTFIYVHWANTTRAYFGGKKKEPSNWSRKTNHFYVFRTVSCLRKTSTVGFRTRRNKSSWSLSSELPSQWSSHLRKCCRSANKMNPWYMRRRNTPF